MAVESLLNYRVSDFFSFSTEEKEICEAAFYHIEEAEYFYGKTINIHTEQFTLEKATALRTCFSKNTDLIKQCELVDFIYSLKSGISLSTKLLTFVSCIKYLATKAEEMQKFESSMHKPITSAKYSGYGEEALDMYGPHNLAHKLSIVYNTNPIEVNKWPYVNCIVYSSYIDTYQNVTSRLQKLMLSESNTRV